MALWEFIDRLAGATSDDSDVQRWRGRFIAVTCSVGAVASLLLGLMYAVTQAWLDAALTPGGAFFCAGLVAIWRATKRADVVGHLFGAFASAIYFAGFLVHRELSLVAWLIMIPLLVLFLGGRRLGTIWFGIELLLVGAAVLVCVQTPQSTVHDELLLGTALVRMLSLMIVVFGLGVVFEASATSVLERLKEATDTKIRFLANVSHELRTPLNGILGMAELMSQDALSSTQREQVATIIQSGQHLRLLIDDVLDATQLDRGHLHLNEGPVTPAEVAQTVIRQLQSMADAKRLTLALEKPGDVLSMRTDALRLMQVISNFVSNAIKFTDKGGVTVVVQTTREPDERVRLVLEVRDTGPGIAPHDLSRLFQPFTRLNKSHAAGTGLGLSISRTIAQLLGGTVSAKSHLGHGSTFRLELVRPRAMFSLEMPVVHEPEAPHPVRRARVLLVDDNLVNLKVARGLLEKLGCEVVTAADGAQAIEAFKPGAFDLVLMDLHMPVMDGFESAKKLREKDPAVRILALSATTVHEEIDAVSSSGMNGFLPKPVRLEQLKDALPHDEAPQRASA